MKKTLALVLVFSLMATMFMGMTAMAEDSTVTVTNFAELKDAVENGTADVILIGAPKIDWMYGPAINVNRTVEIKSAPGVSAVLTGDVDNMSGLVRNFDVNAGGVLTVDGITFTVGSVGAGSRGGIKVDGGKLIVKNSQFINLRWTVSSDINNLNRYGCAIRAINGAYVEIDNCVFDGCTTSGQSGTIYAGTGAEVIIRDASFINYSIACVKTDGTALIWFDGTIVMNLTSAAVSDDVTWAKYSDINWETNGFDKRPITPDDPDPTAPTGTDKVNGNTGIEITADPPTLIDPADPYVATIFDAGYIGGSDLWFGTHLASSEPQELPSIDNGEGKGSLISLVTYNQHKVNGIYGIKGQIGIFARNDEAKTPVIEDFSLSLEATTTKWCKDDDSAFVPKFTAHNITSGFAMGPNEDPLTLFDTDTVGYMLSDYKGVLTLPADAVLATGVATAVMTWTIEAEVI